MSNQILGPFIVSADASQPSLVSVRKLENQGLFKAPSVTSISAFLIKSWGMRYVFVGVWKGVN